MKQSRWARLVVAGVQVEVRVVEVDGEYFGLCLPINLAVDGATVAQVLERMQQLVQAWMSAPEHHLEEPRPVGSPPDLLQLVEAPGALRFTISVPLPPPEVLAR